MGHKIESVEVDDIYKLKLHQSTNIAEGIIVTRVPGGWIYEFQKPQVNILQPVFVPFNNEFQNKPRYFNG